jgi:hypothetical protein
MIRGRVPFRMTALVVRACAVKLGDVAGLLALFAAELSVGSLRGHEALAGRTGALGGLSHDAPPGRTLRLRADEGNDDRISLLSGPY